ncbi:MAG: alpha/beta hydrolase [Gammaproteobacteria bacterium]|nr:alpha/beta hydrolase [Gammaproteobacteria bacterium]
MPVFERGDTSIYYEEQGSGFPVLLIASGGMRSAIPFWDSAPWNPIEQLRGDYRVIAMDQRNAGKSTAPVKATDSWHVYTEDQLALMDHLGVEKFHVAGMCIGGPFCMGLVQTAPDRVASAVLFQTIGLHENREAFFAMFDDWAKDLKPERPEVAASDWDSFRQSMYGGEFLLNVSRDFVAGCETPLLVLCGNDLYHPEVISREVAELAPNAEFVEHWKEGEDRLAAKARVAAFLVANTPG